MGASMAPRESPGAPCGEGELSRCDDIIAVNFLPVHDRGSVLFKVEQFVWTISVGLRLVLRMHNE